eukprot:4005285-Pleurochrysis_carterae.AAC.1
MAAGGSAAYVADAESAYRFYPVQQADLWTQCFVWWDAEGKAGVVVDRRMGFGGAFAPNRFERVYTLMAAWVQRKQTDFDAGHPYPPTAQRWAARRAAHQRRSGAPGDAAHLAPRYLQVYIDDFSGVALTDEVEPPAELAHVVIDPVHTRAAGGEPAAPTTRAYVHAQLAVGSFG